MSIAPPPAPPPDALAASLRAEIAGATLIVGPGQYSPHPGHERLGVIRVHPSDAPSLLWDGFVPTDHIPAIRAALGAFAAVWPGELDTMAATPWTWAWTVAPAPFHLYGTRGLRGVAGGGTITLIGETDATALRTDDLRAVHAWVSEDWVRRGVDLVRASGERITVVEASDAMAALDPTYDGLSLMVDASWAKQLGLALGAALGVPYTSNDPALA